MGDARGVAGLCGATMVEFLGVTRDNVDALIGLNVADDQAHLVAPNAMTLAQAAYESGAHVWGIYAGDEAVGLTALLDPRGEPAWLGEDDDRDAAFLWRLMIAEAHQGKGYGNAALDRLMTQARDWGLKRFATSVVDGPGSAFGFYEAAGMFRTGRIVEGEAVLSVDL